MKWICHFTTPRKQIYLPSSFWKVNYESITQQLLNEKKKKRKETKQNKTESRSSFNHAWIRIREQKQIPSPGQNNWIIIETFLHTKRNHGIYIHAHGYQFLTNDTTNKHIQHIHSSENCTSIYKPGKKMYTILRRDEVNIAVTERTTSDGVATDSNRSQALEFLEGIKQLTISHVQVQVADVNRCRRRRYRWLRNRHCHLIFIFHFFFLS